LVLLTPRAIRKVSSPVDIGRSTLIAFTQGCSYRKRIEEWLGSGNVMPERILEFSSYQAMIACVAAGTGFAVVPKSVLQGLRASKTVRQHALPRRFSHNRTYIVWNGDPSPSLQGLLSLFVAV
jgi:DNA-binding transcriptional LysR family regulator